LLFFDNVDDATEYAALPRKKDELMHFVRRVKGDGTNFIADKSFSEEFFVEDVQRELRNADLEFSSFSLFIDTDDYDRKKSLKYIEVVFGSARPIPVKDLRSFALFSSMFMSVKKSEGYIPELIYGILLKKDDVSGRGGLEPQAGEVRLR